MKEMLTWSKDFNTGRVANEKIMVDINEKPDLGFEFDSIILDHKSKIKFIDDKSIKLNKGELRLISKYVAAFKFPEKKIHFCDYDGIYIGIKPIGLLKKSETIVPNPPPNFNNYIWDDGWEKVVLVILEEGLPIIEPPTIPTNYVLLFTKKNVPELPLSRHEIWDFVDEKFKDTRSFDDMFKTKMAEIRNYFQRALMEGQDYIPYYEMQTWDIQVREAEAYKKNSKAKTPYITAFIKNRDNKIKKKDFITKILQKDEDFKTRTAAIMARQFNLLNRIKECKTIHELNLVVIQ